MVRTKSKPRRYRRTSPMVGMRAARKRNLGSRSYRAYLGYKYSAIGVSRGGRSKITRRKYKGVSKVLKRNVKKVIMSMAESKRVQLSSEGFNKLTVTQVPIPVGPIRWREASTSQGTYAVSLAPPNLPTQRGLYQNCIPVMPYIAQGDTLDDRQGNQIRPSSMVTQVVVTMNPSNAIYTDVTVFVAMVQVKKCKAIKDAYSFRPASTCSEGMQSDSVEAMDTAINAFLKDNIPDHNPRPAFGGPNWFELTQCRINSDHLSVIGQRRWRLTQGKSDITTTPLAPSEQQRQHGATFVHPVPKVLKYDKVFDADESSWRLPGDEPLLNYPNNYCPFLVYCIYDNTRSAGFGGAEDPLANPIADDDFEGRDPLEVGYAASPPGSIATITWETVLRYKDM